MANDHEGINETFLGVFNFMDITFLHIYLLASYTFIRLLLQSSGFRDINRVNGFLEVKVHNITPTAFFAVIVEKSL